MSSTQQKSQNMESTCWCAACQTSKMQGIAGGGAVRVTTKQGQSQSPFLRLPREIRDKIYGQLLIARLKPGDQAKYDQIKAALRTPYGELGRENALDYFSSDLGIIPGANERYRYKFIIEALGLLLANKQIHEEANDVLFSKNGFMILVEWKRVFPFWRCENPGCEPGAPCFIMFHNFKKIKHLYIIITNKRAVSDPMLAVESSRLLENLKTIARCFLKGGNKLKTLKIRYISCFDGQIEAVRDAFEGEPEEGMPERNIMIKDCHGKYHGVKRAEAHEYFFKHCKILDPLKCLRGIAEDVKIRGDLPQTYMDELTGILSVTDPAPVTKQKQMEEEATRKQGQGHRKPSFQAFMKEMAEKYEGKDDGMVKFCRNAMKTSVKSPAVMAELFKPPTKEEMERYRDRARKLESNTTSLQDGTDEDAEQAEEIDETSACIGYLDGKPMFGPERPPTSI